MEKLLYNLLIQSYSLLIRISSPFNKKAQLWVLGRKGLLQRLTKAFENNKGKVAWFHCASLGEFEQGRPVIERFKDQFPDFRILLTFFSPSGYEIRKDYAHADFVFYLPLDTNRNASRFVAIVNPAIAFFVKYEFWYHHIHELSRRKIPVISISSIFRDKQVFFRPYGRFYANILKEINHFFVQDERSKTLLEGLNINDIVVSGDTRFDRVKEVASKSVELPVIKTFKNDQLVLVAGSTWPADMEVLLPFINEATQDFKIIIAPHEINPDEIDSYQRRISRKSIKYSLAASSSVESFDVLFIDNIGMLSSIYQYADYSYVGGGFGKGIHNILEPVTHGIPVFFGPQFKKFKEAVDLARLKVAVPVTSTEQLFEAFQIIYDNPEQKKDIYHLAKKYIDQNTGATQLILDYCRRYL